MELDKLGDERIFDFVMTVPSVVDKEGEVMPEAEMEEALDRWMINNSPITMDHSNHIVGKGIRWWKANYKGNKAYLGRALINSGKVGDMAWEKIKDGTYKDVSIGGASFDQNTDKDGVTALNDLEILEVSLCEDGMHPDADILDHNQVAKKITFFAKGVIKGRERRSLRKLPDDTYAAKSSTEKTLTNKTKGGPLMVKKQEEEEEKPEDKPEEKPEEEKEEEEKPEEEEKQEGISREEVTSMLADLKTEIVAELQAPAELVEEATKQDEGGGEPTPDGTEEDSPEGEAGDAETDTGIGAGEDGDIAAQAPAEKAIRKIVAAEIKKRFKTVEKATTPRPNQAADKEAEGIDAYKIAKGEVKADFATIREAERQARYAEMKGVLGR